jgi:hypothetical protein
MVQGLRSGVWGLEFRIFRFEFRVWGSGLGYCGLGFRISGFAVGRFRV